MKGGCLLILIPHSGKNGLPVGRQRKHLAVKTNWLRDGLLGRAFDVSQVIRNLGVLELNWEKD